uniref:Uncharacterized protein n=1 Tax=Chromera velia CCMP2878 TaxID=1169474 RepID=A0A0G4IDH4_9ALVE|eukprot:Cvel_13425.t1-p1 / transcript=Cvel_13425.t1 / gene=Cvel_13425 / organism=Chromera_velia_CCMP2878 / gene_product=hypothetical protein / transcript_product=hypothetical protein / location=Cvel_scaffold916:5635-6105(+) / protein_length=157 / sequence_SO=supercontig / SO=protein_coding / is_pseudo=false
MGRFLPTKWTGANTYVTGSKNIYNKSVIYIGKTKLEPVDPALPPKEVSGDELKQLPVTHPYRQLKGDNGKKVREEFQVKITRRFEEEVKGRKYNSKNSEVCVLILEAMRLLCIDTGLTGDRLNETEPGNQEVRQMIVNAVVKCIDNATYKQALDDWA